MNVSKALAAAIAVYRTCCLDAVGSIAVARGLKFSLVDDCYIKKNWLSFWVTDVFLLTYPNFLISISFEINLSASLMISP